MSNVQILAVAVAVLAAVVGLLLWRVYQLEMRLREDEHVLGNRLVRLTDQAVELSFAVGCHKNDLRTAARLFVEHARVLGELREKAESPVERAERVYAGIA